jgi:hypothetical protein
MNRSTLKTAPSPSTQLRKAVPGGSAMNPGTMLRLPRLLLAILTAAASALPIHGDEVAKSVPGQSSFRAFQSQYPLVPVRDYTFLGTENSMEKPIVWPDGRIEGWFDPADTVTWIGEAVKGDKFECALVDDYLPVLRYSYHQADTSETCEMTTLAVDGGTAGSLEILVRMAFTGGAENRQVRCLRLPGRSAVEASEFERSLESVRLRWRTFFERGFPVSYDDPLVTNACKASLIRALITFSGKRPHYGVREYGKKQHDAFPPTIIALVHCLLDWGHAEVARDYLAHYFDLFVKPTGIFDYYGPSLAEYGQMLSLVRRLSYVTSDHRWLEAIRPKLEAMRGWIWAAQAAAPGGLIAGVPEADTRDKIDVYFHNNAWCWRGLREIAKVLGHPEDEARSEAFKQAILSAVRKATDASTKPHFIPPVARPIKPFNSMIQDAFASYTNYRYWPELLSSGILPPEQMEVVIEYRVTHNGEVAGMTRFSTWTDNWADNWPMADYAAALWQLGRTEEVRRVLLSHLAGHMAPQTWTAYEQVATTGKPYRKMRNDYCVPSQLVAPRLAAWLWKAKQSRP